MKEKEIENNILEYLANLPNSKFWKNQSTAIWDPSKRVFRKSYNKYHINGVSDILGVIKSKFVCIEVKSKTGRLSSNQKMFLDEINKLGGIAFVARSIDDCEEKFKQEGLI